MSSEVSTEREIPQRFIGDSGSNLVEYSLLVALIFVVALSAVQVFGKNATNKMSCASSAISTATGAQC